MKKIDEVKDSLQPAPTPTFGTQITDPRTDHNRLATASEHDGTNRGLQTSIQGRVDKFKSIECDQKSKSVKENLDEKYIGLYTKYLSNYSLSETDKDEFIRIEKLLRQTDPSGYQFANEIYRYENNTTSTSTINYDEVEVKAHNATATDESDLSEVYNQFSMLLDTYRSNRNAFTQAQKEELYRLGILGKDLGLFDEIPMPVKQAVEQSSSTTTTTTTTTVEVPVAASTAVISAFDYIDSFLAEQFLSQLLAEFQSNRVGFLSNKEKLTILFNCVKSLGKDGVNEVPFALLDEFKLFIQARMAEMKHAFENHRSEIPEELVEGFIFESNINRDLVNAIDNRLKESSHYSTRNFRY